MDRNAVYAENRLRHDFAFDWVSRIWAAPLVGTLVCPFAVLYALLSGLYDQAPWWLAGSIIAYWLLLLQVRSQAEPFFGARPKVDRIVVRVLPALGVPAPVFAYVAWRWLDLAPQDFMLGVAVVTAGQSAAAMVAGALWACFYTKPAPDLEYSRDESGAIVDDALPPMKAYVDAYLNTNRDAALLFAASVPPVSALLSFVAVLIARKSLDLPLAMLGLAAGTAGYWVLILELWLIAFLRGRSGLRQKAGAVLYTGMMACGLPGLYLGSLLLAGEYKDGEVIPAALAVTAFQAGVTFIALFAALIVHSRPPARPRG